MAEYRLTLPEMGEGVAEATVIKWLKEVGDLIDLDDVVLEIATDKVDSDVPSPVSGKLVKRLVAADAVVKVGEAVALIEVDAAAQAAGQGEAEDELFADEEAAAAADQATAMVADAVEKAAPSPLPEGRFYSPLVKAITQKENISKSELDAIRGSGAQGRVTKDDVLAYLQSRQSTAAKAPDTAPRRGAEPVAAPQPVQATSAPGDQVVEMDRMRRMIADHMVQSKRISPHVTSFVEADVTRIVHWRNRIKARFLEREGEKITFTPLFIQAVVKAIKDFPMVNVSVDGDRIIKKKAINVGMATALPGGNLIVPVIKHADRYSLSGLSKAVNDLATRARENRLKPDEVQGGTYTVTNLGSFGNLMGTPIINQPQVAILALGAIRKLPAVVETPEGDVIAIRHKMILSHAYDHRVVDGALGGLFVRRVADYLEAFDADDTA